MYNLDWKIEFDTNGKKYGLGTLGECEIVSSVDNLTDTATIVLPGFIMNERLQLQDQIKEGTEVKIDLGYNGSLKNEFTGFVKEIRNNDNSLKIICEDAYYLFRKSIKDKELKPATLKDIASYLTQEIDPKYAVKCSYEIQYEKFTILQNKACDVLKKIQEETLANIYFDTEKKELHIHPPYTKKTGAVKYSMLQNIESSNLEYKNRKEESYEITVESTDLAGNVNKATVGNSEGDQTTINVGAMDQKSMETLAENALRIKTVPTYQGSFDAWLVPYVKPSFTATIADNDFAERNGKENQNVTYYVKSVTTSLSESGGKRTIEIGLKQN